MKAALLPHVLWRHMTIKTYQITDKLVQANQKSSKPHTTGPLLWKSIGDQLIPLTKGPVMRKAFPCHYVIMYTFSTNTTWQRPTIIQFVAATESTLVRQILASHWQQWSIALLRVNEQWRRMGFPVIQETSHLLALLRKIPDKTERCVERGSLETLSDIVKKL